MYGSLTFLLPSNLAVLMANISFNVACKELKIAQIAQLNQVFQLLHSVHIYGQGFYELSRMLMRKNVNNDISKDSPLDSQTEIEWKTLFMSSYFHCGASFNRAH